MEATEKNEKIARAIINTLAENNCTIEDASKILRYVLNIIGQKSVVQKTDKLFTFQEQ